MRRRFKIWGFLVAVGLLCALTASLTTLAWHHYGGISGIHQRAITLEITEWGREYSHISDDASAIRAAGMIGYIENYYVPAKGYRSTPEIERSLQNARENSLTQIVNALEAYTGLDYGLDAEAWEAWADSVAASNDEDPPVR